MRVSAEFTDDRNGGNEKKKEEERDIHRPVSQAYHFKPIEWVAIDRQ